MIGIDFNIIYLLIFLISLVQSIVGVGILVVGTPLMLILKFGIIEIMYFLLPLSILTSLINLYLIKFIFKEKMTFEGKIIKHFFFITIIGLFLGLIILKYLSQQLNFNIIVAFIILFSILLKIKLKNVIFSNILLRKFYLFLIGAVHGLTNSGGTLLTILMFNKVDVVRGVVHFFYLILASIQLLILRFVSTNEESININWFLTFATMFIASLLGGYFYEILKDKINYLIYTLAILTCFVLLWKTYK